MEGVRRSVDPGRREIRGKVLPGSRGQGPGRVKASYGAGPQVNSDLAVEGDQEIVVQAQDLEVSTRRSE